MIALIKEIVETLREVTEALRNITIILKIHDERLKVLEKK